MVCSRVFVFVRYFPRSLQFQLIFFLNLSNFLRMILIRLVQMDIILSPELWYYILAKFDKNTLTQSKVVKIVTFMMYWNCIQFKRSKSEISQDSVDFYFWIGLVSYTRISTSLLSLHFCLSVHVGRHSIVPYSVFLSLDISFSWLTVCVWLHKKDARKTAKQNIVFATIV